VNPGTRQLTGGDGVTYLFDPGSFCLELLLSGGPPPWDRYELLHSPADLADWLTGSRLALEMPLTADELRIRPVEWRRIRELRDTLWRAVPAKIRGERPRPEDVAVINEFVGEPPRPRLDQRTAVRSWAAPVTGTQVAAAAAREAIELIGTDLSSRVRQCEGVNCYLMFLDTSRPGNRRWCSMQRCGNRHKVGAYRTRHSPHLARS
jgi:predicted RNA-binding Zn ribbon-like protein